MNIEFEVQTAIFSAMTSSSTLTNSVSNRIYGEMPANKEYPYIVLNDMVTLPHNRHGRLGYQINICFFIYTKPGLLGDYEATNISSYMNSILNMKKLALESSALTMVVCKLDRDSIFRKDDIIGIEKRLDVIVHDSTLNTY